MEMDELGRSLWHKVNKEQELYGLFTRLARETEDDALREVYSGIAREAHTYINTITDKYLAIVNGRS